MTILDDNGIKTIEKKKIMDEWKCFVTFGGDCGESLHSFTRFGHLASFFSYSLHVSLCVTFSFLTFFRFLHASLPHWLSRNKNLKILVWILRVIGTINFVANMPNSTCHGTNGEYSN